MLYDQHCSNVAEIIGTVFGAMPAFSYRGISLAVPGEDPLKAQPDPEEEFQSSLEQTRRMAEAAVDMYVQITGALSVEIEADANPVGEESSSS